jgi:tetratricopeptide (TPR) repeat protein
MAARSSPPYHRLSRRAQRRQKLRRVMIRGFAGLVVLWAFGAGYLWRQWRGKAFAASSIAAQASEEQQAEAMRLLDEGVRARYEGRWQGAMNALMAARQSDPQAKGLNILVGEIAIEQKDPDTLRQAVRMAMSSGENEASAKLLHSLQTWMQRGETGVDQAGSNAEQALEEAAEAQPSNASVYFFRGELNRLLGDNDEAQKSLLACLHRQTPWLSSALLEVKMHLAASEASAIGKAVSVGAPSDQARAALGLHEAGASAENQASGANVGVLRVMPLLQLAALGNDQALGRNYDTALLEELRLSLGSSLPMPEPAK